MLRKEEKYHSCVHLSLHYNRVNAHLKNKTGQLRLVTPELATLSQPRLAQIHVGLMPLHLDVPVLALHGDSAPTIQMGSGCDSVICPAKGMPCDQPVALTQGCHFVPPHMIQPVLLTECREPHPDYVCESPDLPTDRYQQPRCLCSNSTMTDSST